MKTLSMIHLFMYLINLFLVPVLSDYPSILILLELPAYLLVIPPPLFHKSHLPVVILLDVPVYHRQILSLLEYLGVVVFESTEVVSRVSLVVVKRQILNLLLLV